MHSLNSIRTEQILKNCEGKKIAVIGDVMLDKYFWGSVSRISPESPVPVVDLEKETYHLGGAANVANNLKALGLSPLLCGIIGDDKGGVAFSEISDRNGIDPSGLFRDKNRPTTVKTRVIGNNQQIVRLDKEKRFPIPTEGENFILDKIKNTEGLSTVIFEDYNKGCISENLIKSVIEYSLNNNIAILVDPKFNFFFDYKGITVFKPNKKEAAQALGMELNTDEDIIMAGKTLLERLECENVLLTLGKDGMMLFEKNGAINSVPTRARHVADVSGAGDTAIATLSAAYCSGANIRESATLANYASGVVCEMPGIVPIEPKKLIRAVELNSK